MTLFRAVWQDEPLYSPFLKRTIQWLNQISLNRFMVWFLFGIGILRSIVSLMAYPPAHGSDSMAYFFYADHLSGQIIPSGIAQAAPPLYPVFLLIGGYQWLGSAILIIGLQIILSASIAPLYFLALKRISVIVAMLSAWVIVFDFQTAVVFNFTSTEPLYIFLLALLFYSFLRQTEMSLGGIADSIPGGVVILLLLTRAVARFLIIPLVLVFWWRTRSLKRTGTLVAGFAVSLLVFALTSQILLGQVEGLSSSNYLGSTIISQNNNLVSSSNGPASAAFQDLSNECEGLLHDCYAQKYGSLDGMVSLYVNTFLETFAANWQPLLVSRWTLVNDFLSLSGQQYGIDPELPGEVQCLSANGIADQMSKESVLANSSWAWSIRGYIEENFEAFRERFRSIALLMCPSLSGSPEIRQIVDAMAERYRSLGRPRPYLYYGGLAILVLLLPWARRYRIIFVSAGSILLYHAVIAALVQNVQPRYVMVTNPLRVVLLILLVYILVRIALIAVDQLWRSRHALGQEG